MIAYSSSFLHPPTPSVHTLRLMGKASVSGEA